MSKRKNTSTTPESRTSSLTKEQKRYGTAFWIVLTLILYGLGHLADTISPHGPSRFRWLVFSYGIAFLFMFACIAAISYLFQWFDKRERAGTAMGLHKRATALVIPVLILIPSAYNALGYGTRVVFDLFTGPQTVTVSSCTHEIVSRRESHGRYRTVSVTDYHFIMTLADGTTRQTVIDTRVFLDDRRVDEVLYSACIKNPGTTSMTLDVYYYSWIIDQARLD